MRRFKRGVKTAFTLIEIMIALFMIAIAIAGFIPASLNSREMVLHNRHRELATVVASAVLDQDRQTAYSSIKVGTSALPAVGTQPDLPNFGGSMVVALVDSAL